MTNLGLTEKELDLIRSVFSEITATRKAVIFGSRAKGNFKKYSDVDIAVFGGENHVNIGEIITALDELPLIYKFDVVAYEELKNAELKEHIDKLGIVFYEKGTIKT
jgi:predicted nucleotidyltransferase